MSPEPTFRDVAVTSEDAWRIRAVGALTGSRTLFWIHALVERRTVVHWRQQPEWTPVASDSRREFRICERVPGSRRPPRLRGSLGLEVGVRCRHAGAQECLPRRCFRPIHLGGRPGSASFS